MNPQQALDAPRVFVHYDPKGSFVTQIKLELSTEDHSSLLEF